MAGGQTVLLFIYITHFFIKGEKLPHRESLQIIISFGGGAPPLPPPENQKCPPPPPPPPCEPPPPPPPTGFESRRLALVYPVIQSFKKKVTYDPKGITKTWNGPNICRDYKGFLCDTVPDFNQRAVSGVNFNNFNFGGLELTINELLVGLRDIVFFHANSNSFIGSIPDDVSKLRYLTELDLSNNKLSGNFPNQVLGAKSLQFLDIRFNKFAGVVPPQLFNLKLDLLFINNNNLMQKLPENLGSTTSLYLTLANNKFIGEIPHSIGQASETLIEVLFLNNHLTGCLPYEIGLLKKATVFDVGFNNLTGIIPQSFQCLEKMELMNLAHNRFNGVVPEAVCGLPALSNFTLSYNYFGEVGPKCRKLIKDGVLNVEMNCILGLPNQRSRADCAKYLFTLDSCRYRKSLKYVPCSKLGFYQNKVESDDLKWTAPAKAPATEPAQAPGGRSYGALSPNQS